MSTKLIAQAVQYSQALFEMQRDLIKDEEEPTNVLAAGDKEAVAVWLIDGYELSETHASQVASYMAELAEQSVLPVGATHYLKINYDAQAQLTPCRVFNLEGQCVFIMGYDPDFLTSCEGLLVAIQQLYPKAFWI